MRFHAFYEYCFQKYIIGGCFVFFAFGCVTEVSITQQEKAVGHYEVGKAYLPTDLQKAIVAFETAIDTDPNHQDAHLELGIVYGQRGRLDVAKKHYEHAIRIDADYSEAHNNLGTVYAREAQWNQAIKHYQRALENPMYRWPDSAYYNLARALSEMGEYDEALIALRNAMLIEPLAVPVVLIHRQFGRIYEKVGNVELAQTSYQDALDADEKGSYRVQIEEDLRNLEALDDTSY